MINKNKALARILVVALLALTLFPLSSYARRETSQRTEGVSVGGPLPRLVVIIIVDQFAYRLLQDFKQYFGSKGFRRLSEGGAVFTNANYDYVPTVTAAGHAAVHTGSIPAKNAIVGNYLVELDQKGQVRKTKDDQLPGIVYDAKTYPVTSGGVVESEESASPFRLDATTLGNQLKAKYQESKVVSMAGKDRSAVLQGGKIDDKGILPDGVYWYDKKFGESGEFITSTYYFRGMDTRRILPLWVRRFNNDEKTKSSNYFRVKWKLALPAGAPVISGHLAAQQQFKLCGPIEQRCDFPYDVTRENFELTPFASDHLEKFAEAAIEGEGLGNDDKPDLLAISFSQPDLLGHAYGPDSQEIRDTYIRLDSSLGALLDFLDKRFRNQNVGGLSDNVIVALTADHGVVPIPNGPDAGVIDKQQIKDAVNKALQNRFPIEDKKDNWVLDIANEQLYLNPKLIDKYRKPTEVEETAKAAIEGASGIARVFTRSEIEKIPDHPRNPLELQVKKGYYIGLDGKGTRLNGDLWIITKRNWFISEDVATTHGSPYEYDTHVPLLLYGPGIKPGTFSDACSPSDIAPTLAKMLAIEKPSKNVGRELVEALVRR